MSAEGGLALACFEAGVLFVDDVYAAFAAYYAAILIALFGGFQRAQHFHNVTPE